MAKADPKTANKPDAEASKPAKKSRTLLFVMLALVLAGGAGGGAWWWTSRDAGTAQASVAAPRAPVFFNLEPFTVNLLEEGGEHYLQTSLVFHVADDKAVETMKVYLPIIRNRILLLLSSKRPSDIASPEGKAKLVAEVTAAVRESILGTTPERGIVQTYIGAFVVQ